MYHKILATAGTAVAIVGVASAALATSGSDPSTTSGTGRTGSQSGAEHHRHHELHAILRHVMHGEVTTKGPGGYVTHSGVRGAVTAVSSTSITVKSVDGYTATFTLNPDTKVRERTAGRHGATSGSVSAVKPGDQVAVLGKAPEHSSAPPVARVVIDGLRAK
jgi:hypothetical protein